jgi:hypothetical protein
MSIRKRISRTPGMPEKMRRVQPYVVDAQGILTMPDRGVRQRNARMVRVSGTEGEVVAQGWRDDLANYFQKKFGPKHRDGIVVDPGSLWVTITFFEGAQEQGNYFAYVLFNSQKALRLVMNIPATLLAYGRQCSSLPNDFLPGAYWIMEDDADGDEQADRFISLLTTPTWTVYDPIQHRAPIEFYQNLPPALWIVPPEEALLDLPKYAEAMLPKLEQMLQRLSHENIFGDARPIITTTPAMATQLAALRPSLVEHPLWLLKPEKDDKDHFEFPAGWEHIEIIQREESVLVYGQDVGTCEYVGEFKKVKKEGPTGSLPFYKSAAFLVLALLGGAVYLTRGSKKMPGEGLSSREMQRAMQRGRF